MLFEVCVVSVFVGACFGPHHMPVVAKTLGKTLGKTARRAATLREAAGNAVMKNEALSGAYVEYRDGVREMRALNVDLMGSMSMFGPQVAATKVTPQGRTTSTSTSATTRTQKNSKERRASEENIVKNNKNMNVTSFASQHVIARNDQCQQRNEREGLQHVQSDFNQLRQQRLERPHDAFTKAGEGRSIHGKDGDDDSSVHFAQLAAALRAQRSDHKVAAASGLRTELKGEHCGADVLSDVIEEQRIAQQLQTVANTDSDPQLRMRYR